MSVISGSISLFSASAEEFAPARIGYHTILPTSTLTASSEAEGYPVSFISDYFTFDAWKATGVGPQWVEVNATRIQAVNYVAFAAHNFYNCAAVIRFQYYDGVEWVDLVSERLLNSNRPFMFEFDDVTAKRFRLFIDSSEDVPYCGVLYIGQILKFQRGVYIGHAPATYNRVDQILNSVSEGGQFLGRSLISEGGQTDISLDWLSPLYVRGEWVPFQDHARTKPFFFSWQPVLYPEEVIYGWSTSTPVPTVSGHNYYSVSISMRGDIDGTERNRTTAPPTPPPAS
jgi:hypothetical protein